METVGQLKLKAPTMTAAIAAAEAFAAHAPTVITTCGGTLEGEPVFGYVDWRRNGGEWQAEIDGERFKLRDLAGATGISVIAGKE